MTQVGVLKDQARPLGQLPERGVHSVQAVEQDVALEGAVIEVGYEAGEAAGQGALATT